jgi:hypothetical protein
VGATTTNAPIVSPPAVTRKAHEARLGALNVHVAATRSPLDGVSRRGRLGAEPRTFPVSIPPGVSLAGFSLDWRHDWTVYDPNGRLYGTWTVAVDPFQPSTSWEPFVLRVRLDGRLVRLE